MDTETPAVSSPSTTTSATTSVAVPSVPNFEARVRDLADGELGATWRPGCPVAAADLRAIELTHWGFDGAVQRGALIVAADHADGVVNVFRDLFAARFPIERMEPISAFGGDDQASMAGNNTSAFNCRGVAGSARLSEHAYGRAIDVNPLRTPYVRADGQVDPLSGAPFADRSRTDPGIIHEGDAAVAAFAAQGWQWGGHWSAGKDYQHFSTSGR